MKHQYITETSYYVPVIGIVEKDPHSLSRTNRISSLVEETYILTMHIIYGKQIN